MDFHETSNVCVIEHSYDSIRFSETLVCKILYGCFLNNCKIQVLGKTTVTSITRNKFYRYSENMHFV